VVLCPGLGFEALRALEVPARLGGGLDASFWSGSTTVAAPSPALAYGEIPVDAQPEIVLTKLAQLRNQ
jgi:hypothetical protein